MSQMVIYSILIPILIIFLLWNENIRSNLLFKFEGLPLIGIISAITMLVNYVLRKSLAKQQNGFEKVKDIVRGTIISDIRNLFEAYLCFKNTPGIQIVAIKEKLV